MSKHTFHNITAQVTGVCSCPGSSAANLCTVKDALKARTWCIVSTGKTKISQDHSSFYPVEICFNITSLLSRTLWHLLPWQNSLSLQQRPKIRNGLVLTPA